MLLLNLTCGEGPPLKLGGINACLGLGSPDDLWTVVPLIRARMGRP